ncbi:putative Ig domain-containing protein [Paraglaciecola aquimarina]|uniref:Ig domain-containing protein n=1 Tax=Paraglaciecola aquimarina TaxID=1235557 RepID=A0ABU3T186_9ALTE|nr:putative Ig domain-containing protein [Paraglaciecola aquimarina]MDU0355982.1 putative Ig domain-containing protein [Paraglaciecola aquimarina]
MGDTANGTVVIEDNGATIHLTGNRWRAINFDYNVTPNTILEFDFKSTVKGEVHGVGLDSNLILDDQSTFNLFGTQKHGIQTFRYQDNAEYQSFSIPIGQYYTGAMSYLFFATDHDVSTPTAQSYFSNVRIYEAALSVPVIDSQPNLQAHVGASYLYDDNSTLEVSGTAPFTYSFNYAPDGMTISHEGKITWTPSDLQLGDQPVEVVVSNAEGSVVQTFTINVAEPFADKINLNNYELISYGGDYGDTTKGTVNVSGSGESITLIGNRWIAIDYPTLLLLTQLSNLILRVPLKAKFTALALIMI